RATWRSRSWCRGRAGCRGPPGSRSACGAWSWSSGTDTAFLLAEDPFAAADPELDSAVVGAPRLRVVVGARARWTNGRPAPIIAAMTTKDTGAGTRAAREPHAVAGTALSFDLAAEAETLMQEPTWQ